MKTQKSPLLPSLPTEDDFKNFKRLSRWWRGILTILTDHIEYVYDDLEAIKEQVVDRGDPTAYDWTSFTTDGTWRDLDCSSVVPEGARFIILKVNVVDDAVGSFIRFRKNGNSNAYNTFAVGTQVVNINNSGQGIVACDESRVIEYLGDNLTFTTINVCVVGWIL